MTGDLKCGLYIRPCPKPAAKVRIESVEMFDKVLPKQRPALAVEALACPVHARQWSKRRYGDNTFMPIDDPAAAKLVLAARKELDRRDQLMRDAFAPEPALVKALETGQVSPHHLRTVGEALIRTADMAQAKMEREGT